MKGSVLFYKKKWYRKVRHIIMSDINKHQDIKIRSARLSDAKTLLAIYAPYIRKTAITYEYEVPSEEEFAERIRKVQERYPYLVAEKDGEILGYAYASAFHVRAAYDWAVETSIYLKENQRGQGLGKQLYGALEQALYSQNILNVYACIAFPEVEDEYLTMNSVNFHKHLGYRETAVFKECAIKFHRWYHMMWMEKRIGEHSSHPEPVIAYRELEKNKNSMGE